MSWRDIWIESIKIMLLFSRIAATQMVKYMIDQTISGEI